MPFVLHLCVSGNHYGDDDESIIDVDFVEQDQSHEPTGRERTSNADPLHLPRGKPNDPSHARIVTITNQKGGVGKTTSVINIAAQLGLRGHRVLVIDADAQGNCATGLGVDKRLAKATTRDLILEPERAVEARHQTAVQGVHLIVGDKSLVSLDQELLRQLGRERRLVEAINPLLPHYDIVLIDTPPSLGIPVSRSALCPCRKSWPGSRQMVQPSQRRRHSKVKQRTRGWCIAMSLPVRSVSVPALRSRVS